MNYPQKGLLLKTNVKYFLKFKNKKNYLYKYIKMLFTNFQNLYKSKVWNHRNMEKYVWKYQEICNTAFIFLLDGMGKIGLEIGC